MGAITFDQCQDCGHNWYLDGASCPRCGSNSIAHLGLKGAGTVLAKSTIHRAPDKLLQKFVPYTVCLVSMPQGFVVMGHLQDDVALGEQAEVFAAEFAGMTIPAFQMPDA